MKDCKPGKIRNPETNRCGSPERINKTLNQYPDIKRENGRCVHVSNINNLKICELKQILYFHAGIEKTTRSTKKELLSQIRKHLNGENATAKENKKCGKGKEINPTNNRCRKSCTPLQKRHPETNRCRKK